MAYNRGSKMKVQLYVPPQGYVAQRWEEGGSMSPLGILYLAAVLEEAGIGVDVVPADVLRLNWKDVRKRIEDYGPDLVGGTTTSENRFDSFRLAQVAKSVNSEIVTVLGGPHISMAREDTLLHVPDVDIIVLGEGERTLPALVRTLERKGDLGKVPGLMFRRNGDIVDNGPCARIEDLDSLPFPARHLVPMEKYNFTIKMPDGTKLKAQNIITSRGCPFDCYFCATPINWGRRMRGMSPERVLEEMEHLIDRYGAEFIWFYDDTFNYNPERVHAIMDLILERKLDIKFGNEFRIDAVDKPLLEKMVRAGLVWGHFGVEAGNVRVRRDVVHKRFDIERAYEFVRLAGELGFTPNAFLIYSHDTETWEEAGETLAIIDRMKDINPDTQVATALLHIYPGTPLEAIAKEKGIIPGDFSWARKKDMKRVVVLPAAQGHVPLFKDKLSWFQIAELVFRGAGDQGSAFSWSKVKAVLRTISSVRVVFIYTAFIFIWFKNKLFGKKSKRPPRPSIQIN